MYKHVETHVFQNDVSNASVFWPVCEELLKIILINRPEG